MNGEMTSVHPLRMAKDLGLILLDGDNRSYSTMSYDKLLDLAEKAFYKNKAKRAKDA